MRIIRFNLSDEDQAALRAAYNWLWLRYQQAKKDEAAAARRYTEALLNANDIQRESGRRHTRYQTTVYARVALENQIAGFVQAAKLVGLDL